MKCKIKQNLSGIFDTIKLTHENSQDVKEFIEAHGFEAHILYDETGEEAPPSLTIHQYYQQNKKLQSVMCAYEDNYIIAKGDSIYVVTGYDYLQLFSTIVEE